jgi:predicted TPR repeat methyltransferase
MLEILKKILLAPSAIVNLTKENLNDLSVFLKESSFKIKNLSKTNYDLALYHISKGNLADAKFRFLIISLFSNNYLDSDYQLARCYIYLGNIKKAKSILNNLEKSKKVQFRLDILNKAKIDSIPTEVIKEDFDFLSSQYLQLCINTQYNAIDTIFNYLKDNCPDEENISILDLGSGDGQLGYKIREKFSNLKIDALDISQKMIDQIVDFHYNSLNEVYNNKYCTDYQTWNQQHNYDLVIACCSLCYDKDLYKSLSILKKMLKENGRIIIILEKNTANERDFCYTSGHFLFSKLDIEQAAHKTGLTIENFDDINIQINTKGFHIILRN